MSRLRRTPERSLVVFVGALVLTTLGLLMPLGWLAAWSPESLAGSVVQLPLDKFIHFFLFAVLFVLGARTLTRRTQLSAHRLWGSLVLLLFLVAYGGAIELLQLLVPTRGAEWQDLVADAAGCGTAAMLRFALRA